MIALYVMSNGTPEENLKQIFRIFDINNDGSISQEELRCLVIRHEEDLTKGFVKIHHVGGAEDNTHKNLMDLLRPSNGIHQIGRRINRKLLSCMT